jgi:hypothetical protein
MRVSANNLRATKHLSMIVHHIIKIAPSRLGTTYNNHAHPARSSEPEAEHEVNASTWHRLTMSIRAPHLDVQGEAFFGTVLALTALLLALPACWEIRDPMQELLEEPEQKDSHLGPPRGALFKSNLLQPLSHHVRGGGVLPHKSRQAQTGA